MFLLEVDNKNVQGWNHFYIFIAQRYLENDVAIYLIIITNKIPYVFKFFLNGN